MAEKTDEGVKIYLGGEAEVRIYPDRVEKVRRVKRYRIPELDESIRRRRTKMEARIISAARKAGVPTPIILDVEGDRIIMERIRGEPVKNVMNPEVAREVGRMVARLHAANIIHGDITPMNMILSDGRVFFVDFGLAFFDQKIEPKGVDLHVFFESLKAYYEDWEELKEAFIDGYKEYDEAEDVLMRAEEIEARGRYVDREQM